MSDTVLYHKDVCLPESCKEHRVVTLNYSAHAREQARLDKNGSVYLPRMLNTDAAELIEAEYEPERHCVVKRVYRIHIDALRDLALVVLPGGKVKTVWVNFVRDTHRTLDRMKYCKKDLTSY